MDFVREILNRNKRSLSLDLRCLEGCEILLKLGAQADIVVENFKIRTMDKTGRWLGRYLRSGPIWSRCRLPDGANSAHLLTGPVTDPIAQAASRFTSLNGSVNGTPTKRPKCDS